MNFWSLLPLLLMIMDKYSVITLSVNESADYQISTIKILGFNSKDYDQMILEELKFPPPFIRMNFFAFNQDFEINLEKEMDFFDSSIKLKVIKNDDHLNIDWDPLLYRTKNKLPNTAEAFGVYNRRKNNFMGIVVYKNVTYYLQPAKKHVDKYGDRNGGIMVSKSPGSLNIPKTMVRNGTSDIPVGLCEVETVSDRSFLNLLEYNFEYTAASMLTHVLFLDAMFSKIVFGPTPVWDKIFGPRMIRLFPKYIVINLNIFIGNHSPSSIIVEFGKMHTDVICLSALFQWRNYYGSNGMAFGKGLCFGRPSNPEKIQYSKLILTVDDGRALYGVPFCQSFKLLAHEAGHVFGAFHDPDEFGSECTPSYNHRYVMYPNPQCACSCISAEYSSCSVKKMIRVLEDRYSEGEPCFTEFKPKK